MELLELEKEIAERAKQAALALFEGESEIMRARGLILIVPRYEFGLDRDDVLHVVDEVNSPDSSRLCVTWRNGKKTTPVSPPPWSQEGATQ